MHAAAAVRFRHVLIFTLLFGIAMTAMGLLLPKEVRIWTFSETGPFEVLSPGFWLLLVALCLAAPGLPRRSFIAPALLALAAGAREADLHKAFTPESILKITFYSRSSAPLFEKLIAGAIVLVIVVVLLIVLTGAFRSLSRRSNWRFDWAQTSLLGIAVLAFCGSLDRLQNLVHDFTGHWLPHELGKVIPAYEEGFESLVPLIFCAALLQYRAVSSTLVRTLDTAGEFGSADRLR